MYSMSDTPEETTAEPQVEEVDYQDKYLRAAADLENIRKRMESDRVMIRQNATISAVEEFLPVVDNFSRATEHIPEEQLALPWVAGIMHIQRQLQDSLASLGVSEIPVKAGDPFDLSIHEAVSTVENSEMEPDSIVSILQVGYKLNSKVIRPARVTVSTQENK